MPRQAAAPDAAGQLPDRRMCQTLARAPARAQISALPLRSAVDATTALLPGLLPLPSLSFEHAAKMSTASRSVKHEVSFLLNGPSQGEYYPGAMVDSTGAAAADRRRYVHHFSLLVEGVF